MLTTTHFVFADGGFLSCVSERFVVVVEGLQNLVVGFRRFFKGSEHGGSCMRRWKLQFKGLTLHCMIPHIYIDMYKL